MEPLLLPSKIELKPGEDERHATLSMGPCYHGYGTTIGNALRRVMLSSLPGAAVTGVKIEGAQHEFSSLEGVQEDVLSIVLNLKGLRMRVFTDEPVRLTLAVKGEKKVTAADIEAPADVEIVNPDLHIVTLTDKKSELNAEIFVRRGRGYEPVEDRDEEKQEIGMIAVDASFSPIREVGFRVENARVGDITNYDKLIMDIETDGTISPQEAVDQSAKTILDHFGLLLDRDALGAEAAEAEAEEAVIEGSEEEAVEEEAATEEEPEEEAEEPEAEEEPEEAPKKKTAKRKTKKAK
ncbi:hypothetical protein AMJ57_05755 [Parcubacteria bacterium SG8_24]|nr:MAG: hypothetical protein AMJ57_05755 [Parcubacteria bacterium SG8_24]